MMRFWAVLLAATVLVGCRNSQPATNPFLRTTVPPPGTGEGAVVVPGEPYYPPGAPGPAPGGAPVVAAPPPVVAPGPAPVAPQPVVIPPRDLKTSPPGGSYQYHQSSTGGRKRLESDGGETERDQIAGEKDAAGLAIDEAPPGALRLAGPSDALREAVALSGDLQGVETANFEEFAGELPGERSELAAAGDDENPDELVEPSPAKPLPARAEVAQAAISKIRIVAEDSADAAEPSSEEPDPPSSSQTVLRVKAEAPNNSEAAEDPEPRKLATSASKTVNQDIAYAFAPDYTSLSGRLEYSHSLRQWKLRYIPIDGQTDSYGGSVVLGESADLADFKPGDQVSVRGALAGGPSTGGGFSPRYRLDRVERTSR